MIHSHETHRNAMDNTSPERKKQRIRVQRACNICKRRKVKCDGNKPCLNCIKKEIDCEYNNSSNTTKKEPNDPPADIDAAESSTMSPPNLLHPQLNKEQSEDNMAVLLLDLAKKLKQKKNIKDTTSLGNDDTIPPRVTKDTNSPWQSFSYDKYRFHRRYQNVLPNKFGKSLLSALPPQLIQENNLETPRIQNYAWNMSGGHYLKFEQMHENNSSLLFFNFDNPLHLSTVTKLLTFYFKQINKPYGIIHEEMFWNQFNNGFLQQGKQNNKSAKLFTSMLYLVLTISIRFYEGLPASSLDQLFTPQEQELVHRQRILRNEEYMFGHAYSIVSKLTFEWESFELIQSWLLIAFYLRTCYRQISCWNALSRAINMCNGMSLYLNRFPEVHSTYDEVKAWHCFWSCFIMDKLISFQLGRLYQLSMPVTNMNQPTNPDTWFHDETIQLFQLSKIVMDFQKKEAQELDIQESLQLRGEMDKWLDNFMKSQEDNSSSSLLFTNQPLYQLQPFLSYLDIRVTFELRYLFCLINPPSYTSPLSYTFPIDIPSLIKHCQLSLDLLTGINSKDFFFVPWWLNLSQLFSIGLVSVVLIHAGIETVAMTTILDKSMKLWQSLETASPKNPPVMLPQCLWCIRMLNQMCCIRLSLSQSKFASIVGEHGGDNSHNKNKFSQFGKVGENEDETDIVEPSLTSQKPTGYNLENNGSARLSDILIKDNEETLSYTTRDSSENIVSSLTPVGEQLSLDDDDDLFANLQWFDQDFVL